MRQNVLSFVCVFALAVGAVGCGAKRAPILVGQSGIAVADSIFQLQEAGKKLVAAGVISPQIALVYQQRLLQANDGVKKLVPILQAIDAAQKANQPTASQIEQALAFLQSVAGDLSIVIAGVPVNEATAQVLKLVQASQQLVATVLVEVAKLQQQQARAELVPVTVAN